VFRDGSLRTYRDEDGKIVYPVAGNNPLLRTAREIVLEYEAGRLNRDAMTYDDLLRAVQEALVSERGGELAEKLRRDFKAALVDEFQDTDPVQYEIFRKVFQDQGDTPLFFIGDPKQAIYSFRGGDIFTYRKAVASIPPERRYELRKNFRTTSRLMDAVNLLFRDDGKAGTFESGDIAYDEDVAASDRHRPLRENGKPDDAPFHVVRVSVGGSTKNDLLFDALAAEVVRTLDQCEIFDDDAQVYRRLEPQDIAVLVETNRDAAEVARKLKARLVPCSVDKTGGIFTSDAVAAHKFGDPPPPSGMFWNFYTLLEAVLYPNDRAKVKRAAASGFFGVSRENLHIADDAILAEWIAGFQLLAATWEKYGFTAFLGKLDALVREKCGRGIRETLAHGGRGARDLADFEEMLGHIFAAAATSGNTPEDILFWLDKRYETRGAEENDDASPFKRASRDEGNAVHVLTVHTSKGLEFPVTFLTFCRHAPHDPSAAHTAHDGNGRTLIGADPEICRREIRQENIRKIYVAMTRAKQRTVVMYADDDAIQDIVRSLLDKAAAAPIPPVSDRVIEEIPETSYIRGEALFVRNAAVPWKYDDPGPLKGSYSSLQPSGGADEEGRDRECDDGSRFDELPEETAAPIFRIGGGAVIGNAWHEILEKIPFDADDDAIRETTRRALEKYAAAPEREIDGRKTADIVAGMVKKTLRRELHSPAREVFRLRDVPWGDRWSERQFDFSSAQAKRNVRELGEIISRHWRDQPDKRLFCDTLKNWNRTIPHGFLTGFIDLFFRRGDFYYVVDWKSNTLKEERLRRIYAGRNADVFSAFDADGIRNEMAFHGYFFQYLLYSAAVHHFLKRTLTGYSWEKNFGGVFYFFLRGVAVGADAAVFADRPSEALLDELGNALGMR
ncbi:MAG: UvrD-helicase domain-containing protein, partial [Victivallaceae bacterium]|nr:UvrD-helicase domain-containing protein [Victivallaceae bacterium]